jgi:hypothetical protein
MLVDVGVHCRIGLLLLFLGHLTQIAVALEIRTGLIHAQLVIEEQALDNGSQRTGLMPIFHVG